MSSDAVAGGARNLAGDPGETILEEASQYAGDSTEVEMEKNPEDLPGARPSRLSVVGWFDRAIESVTTVMIILIVSFSVLQVFMRYVLETPLAWPEEASRWIFLWLVMLGCITITRVGSHIRMPMFVHMLPIRTRPYTDLLAIMLSGAALAVVGYLGYQLMMQTTVSSIVWGISFKWLYLSLPVGAALSLLNLTRADVSGLKPWTVYLTVGLGIVLTFVIIKLVAYSYLAVFDITTVSLVASILFLVLGAPVAHALLLGASVAFLAGGLPEVVVANYFASQVSTNFTMLAIPFFIFMGALMNVGGITGAIIGFALTFVGHLRGGLGQVNIATSAMLGGLSGSSSADSAMVAKLLVPHMETAGYPRAFAAGLTAVGSIATSIIPPSISFLIYASLAGVSVGALFMAGVIPGVLYAAALMVAVWLLTGTVYPAVKRQPKVSWGVRGRSLAYAGPALVLPLGILMLLRGGAMTATEAGAVACVFALAIGSLFYKKGSPKEWWAAAKPSANDTALIMFLLAASGPLSWILIAEQVPARIAQNLEGIDSKFLLMGGIIVFLLLIGIVLEPPPAQVLVVPILAPIAAAADINLIWLGVVLVLTVMFGQITPPVGGLIFIVSGVVKAKVTDVFWECRWLYIPTFAVLLLLALFPALSIWLPRALGFNA